MLQKEDVQHAIRRTYTFDFLEPMLEDDGIDDDPGRRRRRESVISAITDDGDESSVS